MKIFNFFPLSIFTNKLELSQKDKEIMLLEIRKMNEKSKNSDYKKKDAAWTGDTQGFEYLQHNKKFENFFVEVKKNIIQYLDHLNIDSNQIDIYIQRSWGTISKGNEIISKHEHMQSHISFAYYLKKEVNDANFVLFDDIERNEIIPGLFGSTTAINKGIVKKINELNTNKVVINVKEDDIVIFPSKTSHATQSVKNNNERISISADIVCVAKDSKLLEQLMPPLQNWKKI